MIIALRVNQGWPLADTTLAIIFSFLFAGFSHINDLLGRSEILSLGVGKIILLWLKTSPSGWGACKNLDSLVVSFPLDWFLGLYRFVLQRNRHIISRQFNKIWKFGGSWSAYQNWKNRTSGSERGHKRLGTRLTTETSYTKPRRTSLGFSCSPYFLLKTFTKI